VCVHRALGHSCASLWKHKWVMSDRPLQHHELNTKIQSIHGLTLILSNFVILPSLHKGAAEENSLRWRNRRVYHLLWLSLSSAAETHCWLQNHRSADLWAAESLGESMILLYGFHHRKWLWLLKDYPNGKISEANLDDISELIESFECKVP